MWRKQVLVLCLVALSVPVGTPAQDVWQQRYQRAIDLFVAAQFEQARAAFRAIREGAPRGHVRDHAWALEAVCEATLGRTRSAEELIRRLYIQRRDYTLPKPFRSPKVEQLFERVRNRLRGLVEIEQWNRFLAALAEELEQGTWTDFDTFQKRVSARKWTNPAVIERQVRLRRDGEIRAIFASMSRFLMETAAVPAGTAVLGVGRNQRRVPMDGFRLDRFPVTWERYVRVLKAHRRGAPQVPTGKEKHPVVGISWPEARDFCQLEGGRLPTAEEWEYAARGPQALAFPYGRSFDVRRCNTRESKIGDTTAVDRFPQGRSPFGIWDMCGNVWEWTATRRPDGKVVIKGGSYRSAASDALAYAGDRIGPDERRPDLGFRCIRDATRPQALRRRLKDRLAQFRLRNVQPTR